MPKPLQPLQVLFAAPFLRRLGFHARRIGGQMDRHFFSALLTAIIGFVAVAAVTVTLLEDDKRSFAGFGSSFYWAITTVIGSGDASYVSSPGGFILGWLLAFFGVAIVAAMTGARPTRSLSLHAWRRGSWPDRPCTPASPSWSPTLSPAGMAPSSIAWRSPAPTSGCPLTSFRPSCAVSIGRRYWR